MHIKKCTFRIFYFNYLEEIKVTNAKSTFRRKIKHAENTTSKKNFSTSADLCHIDMNKHIIMIKWYKHRSTSYYCAMPIIKQNNTY